MDGTDKLILNEVCALHDQFRAFAADMKALDKKMSERFDEISASMKELLEMAHQRSLSWPPEVEVLLDGLFDPVESEP